MEHNEDSLSAARFNNSIIYATLTLNSLQQWHESEKNSRQFQTSFCFHSWLGEELEECNLKLLRREKFNKWSFYGTDSCVHLLKFLYQTMTDGKGWKIEYHWNRLIWANFSSRIIFCQVLWHYSWELDREPNWAKWLENYWNMSKKFQVLSLKISNTNLQTKIVLFSS